MLEFYHLVNQHAHFHLVRRAHRPYNAGRRVVRIVAQDAAAGLPKNHSEAFFSAAPEQLGLLVKVFAEG